MVLKLIHPDLVTGDEAVKRLMAEGLMARQIRHPNIVAVYDVSQYNGQPYFTMEFVRGGTLRSWLVNGISDGREVSLETAAGLMKSMLAGLSEAHRMGVVHRDLKPENVLLCGDPDAGDYDLKILDFGIAKAIGAAPATRSGGPIGTPIYMAPEQMTSADAVGPQADIYSLSVMLYELLMDAPPQGRWDAVS
jgi:serine/threonine protein kinase